LVPHLSSEDSDTRYLALLTAGSLHYPQLVDGVLQNVFDFEPDISSAARAASASLKKLPQFEHRLGDLRAQLQAEDSLHQSLAARALGVLHDRHSIEGLVSLLQHEEVMCAQSAADALKEITKAQCGTDFHLWTAWYAEHQHQRRIEWLVTALRANDFDLRLSSIDELAKAFGDTNGYFADAPEAEREAAAENWKLLIAAEPELDL
jgi:HEAT repeat protein